MPGVDLFCTPGSGEIRDRDREDPRNSTRLEIKSQEERLSVGIGDSIDIGRPVWEDVSSMWHVKEGMSNTGA
jgi:hypothetical protein